MNIIDKQNPKEWKPLVDNETLKCLPFSSKQYLEQV